MNDIIKVILLNFILIYFLIKKNKIFSMFLIVVLFIYLLYLRANKLLEGQTNIDEKKDEVKFMKMANLDRLLGKLLNVYEHSEEDCKGGYSDFSPCDKKCGITHKYKTYVVERPAGLFGKSCIEEDGRRKKQLCDESDGVYKCIIGESCQEDGDCETNNCDPKTNSCVPKKVCSNTNLDLCNKEECIDLNNHYDYAKREFKYDETETGVKCKLEDKETDTDTDTDEEEDDEELGTEYDPDKISLEQCDSEGNFWLYKDEDRTDTLTSVECKLKIPGSVYYADESDERLMRRNQIYGTSGTEYQMGPGLYCKIGYQFDPDSGNNLKGVTLPIEPEDIQDIESDNPIPLTNYCNVKYYNDSNTYMNSYINNSGDEDSSVLCLNGQQWPPLKYFTDLNNLGKDQENIIPITEMCGRCNNGYRFSDGRICVNCSDNRNNFNQWVQDEDGKYERPPGTTMPMGKNASCTVGELGSSATLIDTCENLKNNMSLSCNNAVFNPGTTPSTAADFNTNCCTYCDNNQYFDPNRDSPNGSCVECPEGTVQDTNDPSNSECTPCPDYKYRPNGSKVCSLCPPGQSLNYQKTKCGNYCIIPGQNCGPNPNVPWGYDGTSSDVTLVYKYRHNDNLQYCVGAGDYRFGYGVEEVPMNQCSRHEIDVDLRSNGDINSLDFYDECCEFYCSRDKIPKVSESGMLYCTDCNDACSGVSGSCTCGPDQWDDSGNYWISFTESGGGDPINKQEDVYTIGVTDWVINYFSHPNFQSFCHKSYQLTEGDKFFLISEPDMSYIADNGILGSNITMRRFQSSLCSSLVDDGDIYIVIVPKNVAQYSSTVDATNQYYNFIKLNNGTEEKGNLMNFYCGNVYQE